MFAKTFRSVVSLLLVSCLLLGLGGNIVLAADVNPTGALGNVNSQVNTTIANLESTIAKLQDEVKVQEQNLADAKDQLETGKEDLAEAQATLDEKKVQLEEAKEQLADVQGMLDKADNALADLEVKAEEAQIDLDDAYAAWEAADAAVKANKAEVENKRNDVTAQIPGAAAALEEALEKLEQAEKDLVKAKTNLDAAQAELTDAEDQLEEMQEKVDFAQDEYKKLGDTVDEIEGAINNYQAKIDEINIAVEDAEAALPVAEDALKEANEALADAETVVANLRKSYEDLHEAVTNPKATAKSIKDTVVTVRDDLKALWASIRTLETSMDELVAAYEELEDFNIEPIVIDDYDFEGLEIPDFTVPPYVNEDAGINFAGYDFDGYEVKAVHVDGYEFEGFEAPAMPEQLTMVDGLLDTVVSRGTTVTAAINYYFNIAKSALSKVVDLSNITMENISNNLGKKGVARVYNWLYNNPDKVCKIVEEFGVHGLELVIAYGPYALDLLEKHADLVIVGIKATAGTTYLAATMGAKLLGYLGDRLDFIVDYKDEVAAVAYKLYAKYGNEAKALIKVYADYLQVEERYFNATHTDYITNVNSLYVAIGDNSCVGESYVDLLAYELAVETQSLLANGATIQSVVAANKDLLAKADLISIGYSMNTCNDTMMSRIETILMEGTYEPIDWASLVGEGYTPKVEAAIEKLKTDLLESGVSGNFPMTNLKMSDVLTIIAECYVYEYIGYIWNVRQALNDIEAINPDAQIILVGMYNPFEGINLDVNGHNIPFGAMMDTLVEAVDLYYLSIALANKNVIFVNAPAVENEMVKGTYEVYPLLYNLFINGTDQLYATEAGHEYIKDQIWNALTLKLLGDVDCDKDIDNVDAMRALQSYVGMVPAGAVCDLPAADVDNDGDVDNIDAMFILQHYVGLRDAF